VVHTFRAGHDQGPVDGLRLARASQAPARHPPRRARAIDTARSIAVTSGKGGVGKTQLSANLAISLARRGQSVLLLDADLGLASLDLALGVHPGHDLLAVVRGQRRLHEIIVEAAEGVHLVPACPGRYDMADLPNDEREQLHAALRELAAEYDCVIIDTGAGIGANTVGFAALGSEILLVTTAEPTSLRDAYAMAKVLHKRAGVDAIRVIANQVSCEAAGLEVYERLSGIACRFLSIELDYLGCVPWDAAVPRAVTQGRPYVVSAPHSKASRALETVVNKLITHGVSSGVVC